MNINEQSMGFGLKRRKIKDKEVFAGNLDEEMKGLPEKIRGMFLAKSLVSGILDLDSMENTADGFKISRTETGETLRFTFDKDFSERKYGKILVESVSESSEKRGFIGKFHVSDIEKIADRIIKNLN
ncbi:MAG: hypothetical protein PHS92_02195 [Candidatus Gracilibacteria bacterium]|nr:hypothetical protein [Candidatus Gracilibacteria bacterium]